MRFNKKKGVCLACVLAMLPMIGCSTKRTEYYPIKKSTVDDFGNIVNHTVGATSDSFVARETSLHALYQNRDTVQAKMYKESGLKITYAKTEINGAVVFLPELNFKEAPRFQQDLPTRVAEHPGWGFANNFVNKGIGLGFGWIIGDTIKYGYDKVKGDHTYNGPYAPVASNNQNYATGNGALIQPYEVRPEVVSPEIVRPEVIQVPKGSEVSGAVEEPAGSVVEDVAEAVTGVN